MGHLGGFLRPENVEFGQSDANSKEREWVYFLWHSPQLRRLIYLVRWLLVDRCNHKFNAKGDEIVDVFLDVTQQAEAADPR